ncbi:MAG: hypothetical protein ACFFG0_18375 [Candidatus Thorarchaeota archaeon]
MPQQKDVKVRKIVPRWKRILLGKEFKVGDTIEITKIPLQETKKKLKEKT